VPPYGVRPGATDHRAQRDARDHDVVRVADDREEVGHHVEGEREVREEEPQAGADASGERSVARDAT